LLFTVNGQFSDFGNAVDAFDNRIFAATAFDVFNFNLKSLSHFVFLSEAPLPSKNGGRV
jgi:hypothetical protein